MPTCAERGAVSSPAAQKKLSFLELHAVKNSSHYLVANNALVADTQVDEALVAFCSEKYRLGYSTSTDSKSMGNTEGTSCHAAIVPSRVGGVALRAGAEILTRGAWCVRATLILECLRHRQWSMGIYLLWMVTCYSRPGEPLTISARRHSGSHTGNQLLVPSASFPRGPTTEVHDVRGQRDGRVVLCLVRELALDSSSSRPRKPHGTCVQLQLSRLLAGPEQNDRGNKTGELHSVPGAIHGPAQRAFHLLEGRGWPTTNSTRRPRTNDKTDLEYKRVFRKHLHSHTWNHTW